MAADAVVRARIDRRLKEAAAAILGLPGSRSRTRFG